MNRLSVSVLFGHVGYTAIASQSQIPLRVGDCVTATANLEFFFKDEGEYERTHSVRKDQKGVVLNIDSSWVNPSTVEWLNDDSRDSEVTGSVFFHQFARVPWLKGRIGHQTSSKDSVSYDEKLDQKVHKETFQAGTDKCMMAKDATNGYQPVVKMSDCVQTDLLAFAPTTSEHDVHVNAGKRWKQQFSLNDPGCGARPIRSTEDPSKCVDAVHPNKVLLTDCSGVDSQKFLFRCKKTETPKSPPTNPPSSWVTSECYILAMGGRKDMCLWWDDAITGDSDLVLRSCNFAPKKFTIEDSKLTDQGIQVFKDRRDDVMAPSAGVL